MNSWKFLEERKKKTETIKKILVAKKRLAERPWNRRTSKALRKPRDV